LVVATAPLIYVCIIPFALLDLAISLYQAVCFPIYGIPRVQRQEHFNFDRRKLHYLNLFEKLNCVYCSYANGLTSFVAQVAARTEQHWCPIRNKTTSGHPYSRQAHFLPYGNAAAYRDRIERVRRDFGP